MIARLLLSLAVVPALVLAQGGLAGTYKGTWTGASADGDFIMRLEQAQDGSWKGEVKFTLGGAEVPTVVKMLKVDGAKVETRYEFGLGENKLESHLEAEIKDGQLSGKYRTKALANDSPVDEGKCSAKKSE